MIKFFLYLLVIPLVIFAVDSININNIFKKISFIKLNYYILYWFSLYLI